MIFVKTTRKSLVFVYVSPITHKGSLSISWENSDSSNEYYLLAFSLQIGSVSYSTI